MAEYDVTVSLKVSVAVEAASKDGLAARITDEIAAALAEHTGFNRVHIHPSSEIRHVESGATGGSDAPGASGAPAGVPLQAEDLTVTPVENGQFEVRAPDGTALCRAPSNHPDWLRAIAAAANAGAGRSGG